MSRVEIKLKRNGDYNFTIWEISAFLNRFNTYHYKHLLLDEIELELSNGTLPEDIFILDGSFKVENIYSRIGSISTNTREIVNLLYIGKPIPLMPSTENRIQYSCFSFVEKVRDRATKYGFNKSLSGDILSQLLQSNDANIYNSINRIIDFILREVNTRYRDELVDELENIRDEVTRSHEEYMSKSVEFDSYKSRLANNANLVISNDYIQKEINEFNRVFNKVVRPFVYVYDRENEGIRILVEGQVNKTIQDDTFVQLMDYKKVNPDFFSMMANAAFTVAFDQIVNKEKNDLEKELLKEQKKESIEKQNAYVEFQKTQVMQQQLLSQELERRRKQAEEQSSYRQGRANNAYVSNQIVSLRSNIYDKTTELSEKYDVKVENVNFEIEV